jgi:hypothetical protein
MKIIPEYFIISAFLTMLILYFLSPESEVIIKYPSPEDQKSCVYIDDANVCYKYHREIIE